MIRATALLLVLAGCAGLPGPEMPAPLTPVARDSANTWAATTGVEPPMRMRFRWRYSGRETVPGRGSVLLWHGDSLRVDFRGPLGSGNGAMVVVGDSALWADPEEDARDLFPSYPLLWALVGSARVPAPQGGVDGYAAPGTVAWRFTNGSDTTEYVMVRNGRHEMVTDVRTGGTRVGRVYTRYDALGRPSYSQLDVPSPRTRLELTWYDHRVIDSLPPDTWQRPVDAP
jgi:hypothetical protein